jgi:hypothetical protein
LNRDAREKKHKAFLERNRIAAGKCRQRKKEKVGTLEIRYHELEKRNVALTEMRNDLTRQIQGYKEQLCNKCHLQDEVCGYKMEEMVIDDGPEVMWNGEVAVETESTSMPLEEEVG